MTGADPTAFASLPADADWVDVSPGQAVARR
jgi:hypothetical protein